VCRTRVTRLLWKRVSHPSSTSSVKGNLEGQAWLTHVTCLVRRGPEECNMAQSARRASKVNTGPLSCEAMPTEVLRYSLRANVPWRFVGNGVKTWRGVKT